MLLPLATATAAALRVHHVFPRSASSKSRPCCCHRRLGAHKDVERVEETVAVLL
jgi:hypothetical protein